VLFDRLQTIEAGVTATGVRFEPLIRYKAKYVLDADIAKCFDHIKVIFLTSLKELSKIVAIAGGRSSRSQLLMRL
jgi:hypothetical protein